MNPIEFSQRFLQAEPGSPEAAALARDLVDDARYPGRFVIKQYLDSSEVAEQTKAKNVLAELRELALVPMAESSPMKEMQSELWIMRTMAEELVTFRRRAIAVLKNLLANHRALRPSPENPPPYPAPRGTRICDLAFILLHRMFHLDPPPPAFLSLPHGVRDRKIKEFQESRAFRSTSPA